MTETKETKKSSTKAHTVETTKTLAVEKTKATKIVKKIQQTDEVKVSKDSHAADKPHHDSTKALHLPTTVFGVEVSSQAIFDTILSEQASLRQGTHKVKHRGEVRGGGKKPFAQKGTGQARAGSIRSPIWVGGGTVFGPSPERNYNLKVNKKVKRLAFHSALTLKAKEHAVHVADVKMTKPSTKELLKLIESFNLKKGQKRLLIVSDDVNTFKSGRNLPNVTVNRLSGVTVQMIVNADYIVLGQNDVKALERMAE